MHERKPERRRRKEIVSRFCFIDCLDSFHLNLRLLSVDLDNIKNNEGISIKIKPGPASKKREIIQRLIQEQAGHSKSPKVVNIPIEIDQDSDSPPPLPLAQIPLRSVAKNSNSPRTTGPAVIDVEQQLSCQDTELEDIKMQLEKRGLLVKPGPISKLKAYLERVKRKEAAIERLPKVKPCPASKKAKYAAKKIQGESCR